MLLWLQFEVAISDEEMALFHDTSGGEAELLFRFAAKMRELLGFDDLDRRGNILEPASMGVKDCETSTAEENLRIDYIPRMVTITGNADFLRVHTLLPKLLGAPGAASTREEQAETSNLDQHVDADVEVAKRALRELVPKQPPLAVLAQLLYDVAVEEFPEQEQQDGPATLWKKSHLQIPEVVHLALWPYKKPNRPWLQWQTLRQMESTERLVFITDIEAARFTAILAASSSGRVEQCNKKSDPDASRRTWPPPRAEQAYAFRKIWVTTPTGLHALASTNAECWAPPFGRKLAPPEIHPPSLVQASYHYGHEEDDISPTVAYVADEHEAENYYDAAPLAEHEQTGLWKARTRRVSEDEVECQ
eukprot:g270.t1